MTGPMTRQAERRLGHNHTLIRRGARGAPEFVKTFGGDPDEASARLRRAVSFERLVGAGATVPGLRTPRCLGWDEATATIVYECLEDVVPGEELASTDMFGADLAVEAGRAVAALHTFGGAGTVDGLDSSPLPLPALHLLDALSLPAYLSSSAAQLDLWGQIQSDRPLVDALHRLRAWEKDARRAPSHCDLRPDQFVLSRGRLYLTDWEEFRNADVARDLGNFAGSWLYRAARSAAYAATANGSDRPPTLVAGNVESFEVARRRIRAFWNGYVSGGGGSDRGLVVRATAYAGWHQYDMSMAMAARHSRVGATALITTGVGRRLLLEPERYTRTIGFDAGRGPAP